MYHDLAQCYQAVASCLWRLSILFLLSSLDRVHVNNNLPLLFRVRTDPTSKDRIEVLDCT